jgi:hypothetical protein
MAIPALAGALIHALPVVLTSVAIRRLGYAPSQIAFARIASGCFFLILTYGAIAEFLSRTARAGPAAVAVALAACATLGLAAVASWDRWRTGADRRRLAWIARRHPRLVACARRRQEELSSVIADRMRARVGEP